MGLFSCFTGAVESSPAPRPKAYEQPRKLQQQAPQIAPKFRTFLEPSATSNVSAPSSTPTTEPTASISDMPAQQQSALVHGSDSTEAADEDVAAARTIDQSPRAGPNGEQALSPRMFVSVPVTAIAPALLPFTDETSEAPLLQYLAALGKHSAGLLEALQDNQDVGPVFGAAYRLYTAACGVLVNGDNAAMLAALGQDVLRAVDFAGRRGALKGLSLESLAAHLRDGGDLISVYGKDGWLLHLACNDHIKQDFDAAHNAVVEALEAVGLEVPGKPTPLPRGVYLDVNRNLRRCLKRMGSGSVAQGLKQAKARQSLDDALELASHLGLGPEPVSRELAALPADVALDVYYSRVVAVGRPAGGGGGQPVAARYGERGGTKDGVPAAVDPCKTVFDMYDKEGLGYLDRARLRALLSDLGALDGLKAGEVEAAVSRAFGLADRGSDGRINAEEFARHYGTLTCNNARKHLRLTLGPAAEIELKQFFSDFCSFGTRQVVDEMDNAHFAKFCKDCNLLGRDLTVTEIDLAFARAKPKGSRKLSFEGFVTALGECAERKGISLEALVRSVLACGGPVARATKADNVRLHDDKSTYTGVYAKGGPKVTDTGHDLAALLDRSDAKKTNRGQRSVVSIVERDRLMDGRSPRTLMGGHSVNLTGMAHLVAGISPVPPPPGPANKRRSTVGGTGLGSSGRLHEMWSLWANFGSGGAAAKDNAAACSPTASPATAGCHPLQPHPPTPARPEMGVTQFIKMVRETGLLDKGFTSVQAELIFVRAKPRESAKLSFEAFERAMKLIAEAKGVSLDAVESAVLRSRGPMLTARQS